MRSSFSSNTSSQIGSSHRRLRTHWRTLALGCAAVGGVGVLWLPGSAQAPAIVPENAEGAPVVAPLPEMTPNAAPASAARNKEAAGAPRAQAASQQESRISIEMRDAPVIDLLMLISQQGNVEITIGSDVEPTLRIPGIRLMDVTPENAIQKAAMSANLRWKKLDDKTYFVGKTLSSEIESRSGGTRGTSSQGIEPIDENWLQVRPHQSQNPLSALPSYNGGGNNPYSAGLVPLPNKSQEQDREMRPIRIRNVRSAIMAYWLDREHQPVPIEIQASEQASKRAINPYPLMPGVDPNISMALNGNSGANTGFATHSPPASLIPMPIRERIIL